MQPEGKNDVHLISNAFASFRSRSALGTCTVPTKCLVNLCTQELRQIEKADDGNGLRFTPLIRSERTPFKDLNYLERWSCPQIRVFHLQLTSLMRLRLIKRGLSNKITL